MSGKAIRALGATIVAMACLAMSSLGAAATWRVTSYGDDPNDPATLRGALHAAHDNDTIDLTGLAGAIVLSYGASPVERELPVNVSVGIVGPGAAVLAIDGNHFSRVFHVFTGINAVIYGLTIRNGSQIGNTDLTANGGGVRNSGNLGLIDCFLRGNAASGLGGGVYNVPGKTLVVKNSIFSGNSAFEGGAIANDGNDTFSDTGGALDVIDSTFSANSAVAGGAISNKSLSTDPSYLHVIGSSFFGNVARGTVVEVGGRGGAISNDGTAEVTNSTFSANQAANGTEEDGTGAGIYSRGKLTVATSTISNNLGDGVFNAGDQIVGAINFPGSVDILDSTFYGNVPSSSVGTPDGTPDGAAVAGYGTVNIRSSTLSANRVGILGAGPFTLSNTILANTDRNCQANVSVTSLDHNISNDTTCATYLTAANDFPPGTDPGLDGGLEDNGGPTKTIALAMSSVAVDAIPPADCHVAFDQRAVPRPQGTNCDIGAFEATPDFYFSAIRPIDATVGAFGTTSVQVNSYVGFHSAVTLAATSVPTGITASFGPNPVTPPSYGSTASTLTFNIGPAVTPATYTVVVKGSSDTSVHSTSVIITVGVTTAGMTQVVGADQAAGCIDSAGVATAVTSKLAQAQADIAIGDVHGASTILNDLLSLLEAQRGRHIHTTCTIGGVTFDPDAVLIADVQALLAAL